MSSNTKTNERLILINDKIKKIFEICENGIVAALNDETLKRPAILMHLVACNKQLQKIQDSGDIKALSIFTPENIRGLRGVKNATAHDYEGVNLSIIEDVIRDYLPNIKTNIDKFLVTEQEINNENRPKAILSRLGNAYSKKVQSKAIKQPQDNEKSKDRDR